MLVRGSSVRKKVAELVRRQALQRCGMGEGIRVVTLRLWKLVQLSSLLV